MNAAWLLGKSKPGLLIRVNLFRPAFCYNVCDLAIES